MQSAALEVSDPPAQASTTTTNAPRDRVESRIRGPNGAAAVGLGLFAHGFCIASKEEYEKQQKREWAKQREDKAEIRRQAVAAEAKRNAEIREFNRVRQANLRARKRGTSGATALKKVSLSFISFSLLPICSMRLMQYILYTL